MNLLPVLRYVIAILTVLTGAYSLFFPKRISGFTGLIGKGSRGISEIRSVMGGAFIGLGVAPFLLQSPDSYAVLGIVYASIGIFRTISIFVDGARQNSNLISLAVEILFAVLLLV